MSKYNVIVMFSGAGSTLKALINGQQNYNIVATICNRPDALGIKHSQAAGIPCHIVDHTTFKDKAAFEAQMQHEIDQYDFQMIAMAGFMRILGSEFIDHYQGKLINIHPSLLPNYPGLNTYARALENKETVHGSTIHEVITEVDAGKIIAQAEVNIDANDDVNSLMQKTKVIEQQLYPQVLNNMAQHYLTKLM